MDGRRRGHVPVDHHPQPASPPRSGARGPPHVRPTCSVPGLSATAHTVPAGADQIEPSRTSHGRQCTAHRLRRCCFSLVLALLAHGDFRSNRGAPVLYVPRCLLLALLLETSESMAPLDAPARCDSSATSAGLLSVSPRACPDLLQLLPRTTSDPNPLLLPQPAISSRLFPLRLLQGRHAH